MGRSVKRPRRIIAILKLPEGKTPLLLVRARSIVQHMSGNSWFPTPEPALPVVEQGIDDLDGAQTETLLSKGDAVAVRNDKRQALVVLLEQLRDYVQKIANANPEHAVEIIVSAGMYVKDARGPGPRVFHAKQTKSEQVELIAPSAGDRASYEFQYSLDGKKTWLPLPEPFTTETIVTVYDLKPGSTVWFRYRANVKGVTGNWSEAIWWIVR